MNYEEPDDVVANLTPEERRTLIEEMRKAMNEAAKELDFEQAARLRDRIHELEHLTE